MRLLEFHLFHPTSLVSQLGEAAGTPISIFNKMERCTSAFLGSPKSMGTELLFFNWELTACLGDRIDRVHGESAALMGSLHLSDNIVLGC